MPRIARSRDVFYEQLLPRMPPAHAERLRQEKATTRQAFGRARQALNAYLARHRATQLEHRCLARLFAEMGYPDASRDEAGLIPPPPARVGSEVVGRLTTAALAADRAGGPPGDLRRAAGQLAAVEDLLRRGIACGAFADPWNILGFQGLFPLSPAREDAVRDPRLDDLVGMVEQTFHLYARLASEAAAAGETALVAELLAGAARLAAWWDPFASAEVSDVRRVHGAEAVEAARAVAGALAAWRARGEAQADLAFWRDRLAGFRAP